MSASRPTWLLDVDGVLNATRPGWGGAPVRRYVSDSRGEAWPIRWAPPLLRRIRALIDGGLVTVVWSTTWCGYPAGLGHAFGLPALPSAFEPAAGRYVGQLKCDAARAVLAAGNRLIWTDDMEVPAFGPLHDEMTKGGRGLLIRPSGRRGLQPEHMDLIEAFVHAEAAGLSEVPVSR